MPSPQRKFACLAAALAAAVGLATADAVGTDTAIADADDGATGTDAVTADDPAAEEAVSAVSETLTDTADDGPAVAAAACEAEARFGAGAEAAGAAAPPRFAPAPDGALLPDRGRDPRVWPGCTDERVAPASAEVLDPEEPAEPAVSA